MKLLLPVFNFRTLKYLKFDLIAGASIFNPKYLKVDLPEADLIIKGWNGFEETKEHRLSFAGKASLNFYIDQFFSKDELQEISLVTVEFDPATLSASNMLAKYGLFEVKSLLKAPAMECGILYDLIADKRPGHKYSPIIHPFHTGVVRNEGGRFAWDTYCLFVNFRPPELKPKAGLLHKPFEEVDSQKMWIGVKKADGKIVSENTLNINYNSTDLISLGDSFESFGGYKNGDQLVFKGGASQFAIFTLLVNHEHQSIGIEHSLPPVYYSSGLFNPTQRNLFYQRAFKRFRNAEL